MLSATESQTHKRRFDLGDRSGNIRNALVAISFTRALNLLTRQSRDTRKLFTLQQLQASATASRDMA